MTCVHYLVIASSPRHRATPGEDNSHDNNLFSFIWRFLSKGNSVILVIDDNAASDTLRILGQHAKMGAKKIDSPEHYIDSGRLVLLGISYFRMPNFDLELLIKKWGRIIGETSKKNNRRAIAVISDWELMISKVLENSLDRQDEYEAVLSKFSRRPEVAEKLKLTDFMCYYNQSTIDRMPVRNLVSLITSHDSLTTNLANPEQTTPWKSDRIRACVGSGINKVMGDGSDELIFRTLRVIYNLNENTLIANPKLFEARLSKILSGSSRLVLDSIAAELRNAIYQDGKSTVGM